MSRTVAPFAALAMSLALVAGCAPKRSAAPAPPPQPAAPVINDGRSLVAAMRQKYGAQFYKTLAFTQNNTLYSTRGTSTTSQWRQQVAVPGKLRIDYLPLTTRS